MYAALKRASFVAVLLMPIVPPSTSANTEGSSQFFSLGVLMMPVSVTPFSFINTFNRRKLG